MTAELRTDEFGPESDGPECDGNELDIGPFKQRLLLAMLLCRCNGVVLIEELTDTLWWDGPPRTAHKNIQVYISHLRKLLAADGRTNRLRHRSLGYQLRLDPSEVDALRFEDLSRAGRLALRRGDIRTAAARTREALALWRGPALADLLVSPALRAEARRLDDRRLAAYEDWFEAELALGNHGEVLEEIEALVTLHPLRERLRSQQLTALCRGGRQAEALAEYDNLRQLLAGELGLGPSPALQRLYQKILSGDPALNAPAPFVAPSATAARMAPRHDAEVVAHLAVPPAAMAPPRPAPLPAPAEAATTTTATTTATASPIATASTASTASTTVVDEARTTGHPAPPPPPPPPRLTGLPRAVPDFTGRQAELTNLVAHFGAGSATAVRTGRCAAVSGPPGSGTTALALQAAQALAARFPDGQILLPMRDAEGTPRPPGELLDDLLSRLGSPVPAPVPARSPGSEGDRSALLRGRLAELRLLLLLDGAADEAQVRPLLPGAGHCSVIVTGCRHLGGLEGVGHFDIGVFSEEEAVELLRRIIGPGRVAEDPEAALRIIRACGLLPLAVRIAGARMAGMPHLPLKRFADRLADSRRLLDELTVGDRSVRDCFDRYVRTLNAADRMALARLAAVWAPPVQRPGDLEELLERLADAHALAITDRAPAPDTPPAPFEMPLPLWVFAQQLLTQMVEDGGL
ncbi:AfsR/SARP family transcriptional regulator [Streptomyces sp. NPDC002577]